MDDEQRKFRNRLLLELREKNEAVERDEQIVTRIRHSDMGVEYIKSQITKLKDSIETNKVRISEIENDVPRIARGDFDELLASGKKDALVKQKAIDLVANAAKLAKKEKKKEEKKFESDTRRKQYQNKSEEHQKQRDMKYGYKCYCKADDTLPDYMRENLKTMHANKGYVWRGCYFYGLLQEERGAPTVMFNRVGGAMQIIETTLTERRIYEKKKQGAKTLISKTKRRPSPLISLIH